MDYDDDFTGYEAPERDDDYNVFEERQLDLDREQGEFDDLPEEITDDTVIELGPPTEFIIRINTEGDAFAEGRKAEELARILHVLANRLTGTPKVGPTMDLSYGSQGNLLDINGNLAGHWDHF